MFGSSISFIGYIANLEIPVISFKGQLSEEIISYCTYIFPETVALCWETSGYNEIHKPVVLFVWRLLMGSARIFYFYFTSKKHAVILRNISVAVL